MFDLGSDGGAAPAKVAESSEFLHDAARAVGGRDVFGRGGERLTRMREGGRSSEYRHITGCST